MQANFATSQVVPWIKTKIIPASEPNNNLAGHHNKQIDNDHSICS